MEELSSLRGVHGEAHHCCRFNLTAPDQQGKLRQSRALAISTPVAFMYVFLVQKGDVRRRDKPNEATRRVPVWITRRSVASVSLRPAARRGARPSAADAPSKADLAALRAQEGPRRVGEQCPAARGYLHGVVWRGAALLAGGGRWDD